MKTEWIQAFMEKAFSSSRCSQSERLKVGCAILKNDAVISCGINGTPAGFETNVCEILVDGELKTRPEVIRAEANALGKLCKSSEVSVGASMFITHSLLTLPSLCREGSQHGHQGGALRHTVQEDGRR